MPNKPDKKAACPEPTDEEVYRVADAIFQVEPKPPGPSDGPLRSYHGPMIHKYYVMARAAIAAMPR